jgi:hypothetical protein
MSGRGFVHVLATRVGIGVYDVGWFDYRLALFEAITVPSMAAQTSQDFHWLVVVDQRMPRAARERLDRAVAARPGTEVLPVEFKSDLRAAVAARARELADTAGTEFTVTSRLDDDDAMHTEAFARLHDEADDFQRTGRSRYAVFSFNVGCMWLPPHRRGYTRYHDSHSLGLSLMEPAKRCQSIYSKPHKEIKYQYAPRGAHLRGIDGDRRWWLYATHPLADSETGDRSRIERILTHRYGYRVDDTLLASFGLDPSVIDRLGGDAEPEIIGSTIRLWERAVDAEQEIQQLRSELPAAGW